MLSAPARGAAFYQLDARDSIIPGTLAAVPVGAGRSSRRGDTRQRRSRSLVGAAGQVYCGDAAQRLSSFAQRRRISARARYEAHREPDFRQRLLRAHRAERVGSGNHYLDIGVPRFQTVKEVGHIGAEQIAAAFHHQGFGRQREAEIERIAEDVADPSATRRIGGWEAEIDAIES